MFPKCPKGRTFLGCLNRLFHAPTHISSGCFMLHHPSMPPAICMEIHTKSCRKGRRNSHVMRESLGNPTSIYRFTNHFSVWINQSQTLIEIFWEDTNGPNKRSPCIRDVGQTRYLKCSLPSTRCGVYHLSFGFTKKRELRREMTEHEVTYSIHMTFQMQQFHNQPPHHYCYPRVFIEPISRRGCLVHYIDVIMTTMASQITSLTVVYSTVYSDADQRKHQSSASLAYVGGIHRDRWIPRTKGQLRGKCFHLMTSSCVDWKICI